LKGRVIRAKRFAISEVGADKEESINEDVAPLDVALTSEVRVALMYATSVTRRRTEIKVGGIVLLDLD
jgi:hypothetical protein